MLNEAQKAKLAEFLASEDAKADDAAEKLAALVSPIVQSAADVVVAEELKGIKKNRDEFAADLGKYKPLGKPDEITAALDELKTLRAAPGKKVDEKEIKELVETRAAEKAADMIAEEAAKRETAEAEREKLKGTASAAVAAVLKQHRAAVLREYAPDVKPLMRPYFEERLGNMLQPVEEENGEPWWQKDVVTFRVVDPVTKSPLTGKNGTLSPRELVESARAGLGEKEYNSKDFSETFFNPRGKNEHPYRQPDALPSITPRGHVDPSAPSEQHFEALVGETA